MEKLLIYTDLDATLIDAKSGDFSLALPLLKELEKRGIPVMLNSSRTASELLHLRKELGNCHPFGAEHGGTVCVPQGYFNGAAVAVEHEVKMDYLGLNYKAILDQLIELKDLHDYSFLGFTDLSVTDLADETGMDVEMAIKAKSRMASEALLWLDSVDALQHFESCLAQRQLKLVKGGRFYYVIFERADKGGAIHWINFNFHEAQPQTKFRTIGIGDSSNDLALLAHVDQPVVVVPPRGKALDLERPGTLYTKAAGPKGWVEGVQAALESLGVW
ncbi:MAG: HAD-IIB family hydrolase [bacterium]|nr:HAD-IIB family hydrolase [bacterium]